MSKVKEEIKSGVWPQRIAYTSFTKAAAYHARDLALETYPEYTKEDFPNFGTLHSICFRLLGLNPSKVLKLSDFARDVPFYKFSQNNRDDNQLLDEYQVETLGDCCQLFLHWKRHKMITDNKDAYLEFHRVYPERPDGFSLSYFELYLERYENYKRDKGVYDFEDMIEQCLKKGLHPEIDVLFVDEAQDNSKLLMSLAEAWSNVAQRSYFAGDSYQCLYTFSGADPSLLIDLPADDSFTLNQSFRVPRLAYEISRKIVNKFKIRYPDDDWHPTQKDGSLRKVDVANLEFPGKTFYLFRTRYLLEQQFENLYQKGIAFSSRRGMKSPLDKKERLVAEILIKIIRDDRVSLSALSGVLDKIPSRIGKTRLIKHGAKAEIAERVKKEPQHVISKSSLPFLGFSSEFMTLLNEKEFIDLIRTDTKEYFSRLLLKYGVRVFLEVPKLILGTIHSVKGLEADNVLLSLEMTRKPFENMSRDADSEGRVFYVGCTRCKDRLELINSIGLKKYNL